MEVNFNKDSITYGDKNITYISLEEDEGYKQLYILLRACVASDKVDFIIAGDCPPFGKRLFKIVSSQFQQ